MNRRRFIASCIGVAGAAALAPLVKWGTPVTGIGRKSTLIPDCTDKTWSFEITDEMDATGSYFVVMPPARWLT